MALRIPSRSHAPIQYSTLQPTRRYSTSFSNHEKDRHVHLRGKIYVPPKDSVYIPSKHLVFKFQAPRFRVKVHPHIEPKPLLFRSGPFKRYYQNSRSQLTPIVPLLKHSSDELQGGQRVFINTLASAAALLDSLGLDRSSWMTIASGAVFLHQLRQSGMGKSVAVNRVPTDLDIIVASSTNESILKKLYANVAFPDIACLRTEPLNHFGFQLTGPALSIAFANRLKVDITTQLAQIHPPDHLFAPSLDYHYPPEEKMLQFAIPMASNLFDGMVQISHPAFIAFYKLMFNRNRDGKQDRSDLVKLMEMGLLDFSDEFRDVIHIMCHGTPHLIKAIEHEIRNIILHPKIQS